MGGDNFSQLAKGALMLFQKNANNENISSQLFIRHCYFSLFVFDTKTVRFQTCLIHLLQI